MKTKVKLFIIIMFLSFSFLSFGQIRDTIISIEGKKFKVHYDLSWGYEKIQNYISDNTEILKKNIGKASSGLANTLQSIPLSNEPCINGSFENNYSGWTGLSLQHTNPSPNPLVLPIENGLTLNPGISSLPLSNNSYGGNFTKIETIGLDNNLLTCSPPFSLQMVKSGSNSIRLGNYSTGYGAEGIAKRFIVTSEKSNYYFQYAIVMDKSHSNTDNSMNGSEAFFIAEAVDMNGNTIDKVVEVGNPGNPFINQTFYLINTTTYTRYYRDWRCAKLDLTSKIGEEVVVMFINSDCSYGGHMGYTYLDAVCDSCTNTNEGDISISLNPDSCLSFPFTISGNFSLPISGLAVNPNIILQIYQNNVLIRSVTNPIINGSNYTFTINNPSTFTTNSNGSCFDLVSSLNFDYPNLNGNLTPVTQLSSQINGSSGIQDGERPGINNDVCFCSSDLCCQIPNFNATLTGNNLNNLTLNLNSGNNQIQEVEVSMVDYHATYSEPGCQPVNMDASGGHIGYMITSTNNLSSLNLVAAQNNSHVLEWLPGSPVQLNNTVNFSVKPPSVINVSCCSVNFSFCIKVRVKDIDCNVCEQILCYEAPNPNPTNCDCGKWGDIFYQNVNEVSLTCGDKIRDILNCKSPLKVNFTYFCNPDTCTTTIDYKIYETATNTLISTVSGLSGVLTTLITPSVTGDYYLLATANCGNKVCSECKIYFTTRCNVVDCCKDSYWKEKPSWNQNGKKQYIDCENPRIFEISEERKNCDTPITIGGTFICNSSNCPAKVVYILYDGQGNLVNTSNSSLTIPVTLPNGEYNVKIEAYCGDKICQECKFKFIKKCEVSSCDCGKWKDNKITVNWRDRRGNQTTTVNCDNLEPYQLSDLCSNVPVTGNFSDFVCIPTNCQAKYSWVVLDQNNNAVASDNDTTSTSFSFNINAAGNYQFVITSKCGDKRCETCRIRFSVRNVIKCN